MSNSGITVLAELASSQWGMVTTAQATRVGLTAQSVSRLARAGQLDRIVHGVYRLAGTPPHPHDELRAAWLAIDPHRIAAERIASDAAEVVSHRSAAVVHELGDLDADILEFSTDVRRQTRRTDVRLHRAKIDAEDWALVGGLPVTTPLRTIKDLAEARTDGEHLAGVVRDAVLGHAIPIAGVSAALGPYAREYGAIAGDGKGVVELMLEAAGIPDSIREAVAGVPDRVQRPVE